MQIIKKPQSSFPKEAAHGGSGARKLYIAENEVKNIAGITYGYLPSGAKFAWHNHQSINEVMIVLKGSGLVRDRDGEYEYGPGDVFIYPAGVEHEIENLGQEEHEFVFVRVAE